MGMFDSVYLKVKCPNCGDLGDKEFQTKDLDCTLATYRVGDSIGSKRFRWLDGTFGCKSDHCHGWQEARDGYRSGFGYVWYGMVKVNSQGIITDVTKNYPSESEAQS